MIQLEIEQKFRLPATDDGNNKDETIRCKLEAMGFVEKGPIKAMVDWYWDVPNTFNLSLNDCWLRYREVDGCTGQWQLKQGHRQSNGTSSSSSTTVYKEIEGIEAVETTLSILSEQIKDGIFEMNEGFVQYDELLFDGYQIPTIPECTNENVNILKLLSPFVRLVSNRSSWVLSSEKDAIQVDLDITNTNYAVGEVEMVVHSDSELEYAKRKVQEVIDKLHEEGRNNNDVQELGPPVGKLENFLQTQRPDHYEALIRSGILTS